MYREQLFANEVMLLPYYIAALNIEHAYYELTGEYEAFEGLCFVDTLDLVHERRTAIRECGDYRVSVGRVPAAGIGFAVIGTVAGKEVNLTWQNLEAVTVNYNLMDVELLFSRNPFAQAAGGRVHQADHVAGGEAAGREGQGGDPAAGRVGEAERAGGGDGGRQDAGRCRTSRRRWT